MNTKENEKSCNGLIMMPNDEEKSFEFEVLEDLEFSCVLPASCNWYCPSILSCLNGYCAVGGKNSLFIFNLQKCPPVCEWDMGVSPSLNVKVTSVSLITHQVGSMLPDSVAIGLEDGLTRIICTKSKSILKEHRKHLVKISAMSWVPLSPKCIISGDCKGTLSVWNYEDNTVQIWNPIPSPVICLQMSPLKSFLFIVGYQNGNIIVGDHNRLEVLLNLKSHLDEITSLSWCPVSRDGKFCFVSGSKDRTIRVWEINSEKATAVLSIPKRNHGKKKEMMKTNIFPAVLWLNEYGIVCGLQSGELLCWGNDGKTNIIGAAHDRIIFALSSDSLTNQFVSVSMDRQLIVWDGSQVRPSFKIPTFGGFVYSLSTALNNPYSVAIGVGDNVIRVLSSNNSTIDYNCAKLWEGIKSKVTVLSFHPTYDGIIGYGTEGGHVGCYSMNSHKSDISVTYHKKVVYSLSWAHNICEDLSGDNLKINCLYTVGGEGTVLMHKMGSFNTDACNIGMLIKKKSNAKTVPLRSDLAWIHDYSYFALGNSDGSIELFLSESLQLLATVNCHKKMINCMAWHHNFSYNNEGTLYSAWLASGSNEDVVCITDFSSIITSTQNGPQLLNPYKQLRGHSGRITRVVWNPHKNAILASSSFDGSVEIWDVERNAPLGNFNGHIGRVYSVLWSHLDADVVYSGGEDFSLRRWKISQLSGSLPPTGKRSKNKKKKKPNKENKETNSFTADNVDEGDVCYDFNQMDNNIVKDLEDVVENPYVQASVPSYSDIASGYQSISKQAVPLLPELTVNIVPRGDQKGDGGRKKKVKSLLKKLSLAEGKKKELMQDDCISLARYLKAHKEDPVSCKEKSGVDPTEEESINLAFYATRQDAFGLLKVESRSHEESGSFDQLTQLEVWRNNIGELLDKAVEHSFMNETLLALAPLGGYDMWKAALLAYAELLEKREKFHMASLYYVALGDVYKAVNVLKENGHFKEALILAKVQLSSDDPLIKELYVNRGKKLSDECNYEQAAECFLAADYIEDAINALAKRGDASSLFTAMKVADIYELAHLSANLLPRLGLMLYHEQKWSLLHDILPRYPNIEIIHFQAVVAEHLVECLFDTDFIRSIPSAVDNHKKYAYYSTKALTYPSYIKEKDSSSLPTFLMNVLHSLEISCKYTKATVSSFHHINFLKLLDGRNRTSNLSMLEGCNEITKTILHGVVYLLNGDCVGCFQKWLLAFSALEQCGCPSAIIVLYDALLPKHISFDAIIDQFHDDKKSVYSRHQVKQYYRNFIAFKCYGIMFTMWYEMADRNMVVSHNSYPKTEDSSLKNSIYLLVSRTNESQYYSNEETFHSCVSWLSSVLLSDLNISYTILQSELKRIDEKLLELDIKRRLNEHIASRKHNAQMKSLDSGNTTDENIVEEVTQLCGHMINTVNIIEKTNIFDLCIQHNKSGDHENIENRMLSCYLIGLKSALVGKLEMFPSDIKDVAFPSPVDSFYILMLLLLKHGRNDDRICSLLQNIASWGRNHGIFTTDSYIGKLMAMSS